MRIVMHVDLDSFYASLEEQRKPEIAGKPVVVCMYSGRGESGAVATANYRARELGIRSGMPLAFARRHASKETVFLPADLEYYRSVSAQIMEALESYSDSFQQVSVDEAYLDVSSCGSYKSAEDIAAEIKEEIRRSFGVTCSIGISTNKLVAKMASRIKKPDGLTVVKPEEMRPLLYPLPVEKIHGIGSRTAFALAEMGIKTAGQLADADMAKLEGVFGRNRAAALKEKAQGIDDSPVAGQAVKQISRIGTLKNDTKEFGEIYEKMEHLAREMHRKIVKNSVYFRTVSITIITTNLELVTRSRTIERTNKLEDILGGAKGLLKEFIDENGDVNVRRVGIKVSNLSFEDTEKRQKSLKDFRTK